MLDYKKMSLFDAPKGSVLVHGCNAQGVWGSGIAVEFKNRFPEAFKSYNRFCLDIMANLPDKGATGLSLIVEDDGMNIGCLITSTNYGSKKDPVEKIILQTYTALADFFVDYKYFELEGTTIYSNKFNSGLFDVPWERTDKVLKEFVGIHKVDWVVCDPNL